MIRNQARSGTDKSPSIRDIIRIVGWVGWKEKLECRVGEIGLMSNTVRDNPRSFIMQQRHFVLEFTCSSTVLSYR